MKTIEIDDDIASLDLAIQDKIALATMRNRPRIGNGALAKLLGVSDSGVRTLIRRLNGTGLLKVIKFDGTREFKVLVGHQDTGVSPCQKVTKTSTTEYRQKMTDDPPPGLSAEERSQWKLRHFMHKWESLKEACRSFTKLRMAGFFADKFGGLVQEIATDPDLPESDRRRLLVDVETLRNFYTAANHVRLHIPYKQAPAALNVLREASQEQLATFYERIQGGQLQGSKHQWLLGTGAG